MPESEKRPAWKARFHQLKLAAIGDCRLEARPLIGIVNSIELLRASNSTEVIGRTQDMEPVAAFSTAKGFRTVWAIVSVFRKSTWGAETALALPVGRVFPMFAIGAIQLAWAMEWRRVLR